ncbi:MAG: Rrf2 family transcriptional regulator [Candidatus Magasanikbacteria bacterium]
MISINRQSDYAIQLIVALSKFTRENPLSLKKFSIESNISFLFLQRIVRSLKNGGLVDSNRGMYGGYFLKRDIEKITVKQIMEAVDGPLGVAACFRGHICPRAKTCSSKQVLNNINLQLNKILSTMVVADYIVKTV